MNRILSVFLAVLLSFSAAAVTAAQAEAMTGDVNADGRIDAADAVLVLQYSVDRVTLSQTALLAADTTGGQHPNAADALCILQKAVGKLRHFPCETTPCPAQTAYTWSVKDTVQRDGYISHVYVCRTYQDYAAYITDGPVRTVFDGDYGREDRTQDFLSLYSEAFFENNSLLFYMPAKGSMHTVLNIASCYTARQELNLTVIAETCFQEGYCYPAVVPALEIHGVEIGDPLEDLQSVHISYVIRHIYTRQDGTLLTEDTRRLSYDFPVL